MLPAANPNGISSPNEHKALCGFKRTGNRFEHWRRGKPHNRLQRALDLRDRSDASGVSEHLKRPVSRHRMIKIVDPIFKHPFVVGNRVKKRIHDVVSLHSHKIVSVALDYNAPCYTPYGSLCFTDSRFFTQTKKTSVSCVGNRGLQAKDTQEIINRILSVLDEVDICVGLGVSLVLVRRCAYYI
jgi:hypothetical protein